MLSAKDSKLDQQVQSLLCYRITLTENGGLRENRTPCVRRRVVYSHRARHALQPVAETGFEPVIQDYETCVIPFHYSAKVAIPGIEPDYPGLQSGALPLC